MNVELHGTAGGGLSRAATDAAEVPGRTDVSIRVYRAVAEYASATLLGVPRRDVKVDVGEHRDGLAVRIAAPLPIPDLDDTAAIAAVLPVLDQARALQESLQQHLSHVIGREITRVNLTVTGANIPERRRVL